MLYAPVNLVFASVKSVLIEAWFVFFTLLKVIVPAIVIVKIMQESGMVEWTAGVLTPLMLPLDLPPVISIVWATTIFTNIYTGLLIYFSLGLPEMLTAAQATTLGALLLLSHSIPVEGAVARRLGVPWWSTLLLRVGGAYLFGILLVVTSRAFGIWQEDAVEILQLVTPVSSLSGWLLNQLRALLMIFAIIFCLLLLLKLLRLLRIDRLLHRFMTPVLRFIKASEGEPKQHLSEMTLIGLTMGLTFGAGLLIRQRDSGEINERESRVTGNFLGVCHGLVDDTILILIIGAKLSGVLFGRIVFSVLLIAILTRVADRVSARLS